MTTQLRAARWSRVSSAKQATSDREGLPFQKTLQDEGIAALNAIDTGIAWSPTHSGRSVHDTDEWQAMLGQAGRTFDVLVVPYTSRLARNAEELLRCQRLLREAGASIYFCEEERHTANESSWEATANEAVGAEAYSRKLSRTMKRTYASRVRSKGLPAGPPPYGYDRGWTVNEQQAEKVKAVFELYATNLYNLDQVAAQVGLEPEHVKVMIRNPAYAGFAQHNGLIHPGTMPAIISEQLFSTATTTRRERALRAPGRHPARPSALSKRTVCGCGRVIRLDGTDKRGPRARHMGPPCAIWGKALRRPAAMLTEPLLAAFSQMRFTDEYIETVVNSLPAPTPAPSLRFDQLRRSVRAEALEGRIDLADAKERLHAIDMDEARYRDDQRTTPLAPNPDAVRAILSDFPGTIEQLRHRPYRDEVLANFACRYISQIEYTGPDHLTLTPNGTGLYGLNEATVPTVVLVGGEGLEPPTSSV